MDYAYKILGREIMQYCNAPTTRLYSVGSGKSMPSYKDNFIPEVVGHASGFALCILVL